MSLELLLLQINLLDVARKLNESAVKKYAQSEGLHILQPTNLKAESFLEELKALEAKLTNHSCF